MSYSEILKTSDDGRFRVRLIADEDASEPCDDGQSPLLRLDCTGYGCRAEHVMATGRPLDDDDRIQEAAERWGAPSGSDWRLFEKYLRACYGTREIVTWHRGSYWYVTYDTARWRTYAGWDDKHPMPAGAANMDEYKAWCEGDCWGYVIEKLVHWTTDDGAVSPAFRDEWEQVEDGSCWGFYGEYSREAALEAFEAEISSQPAPPEQPAEAVAGMERVSGLPPVV